MGDTKQGKHSSVAEEGRMWVNLDLGEINPKKTWSCQNFIFHDVTSTFLFYFFLEDSEILSFVTFF